MKPSQMPTCQTCCKNTAVKMVRNVNGGRRWKCSVCIEKTLISSGLHR